MEGVSKLARRGRKVEEQRPARLASAVAEALGGRPVRVMERSTMYVLGRRVATGFRRK